MVNESLYLKTNPEWEHLIYPLTPKERKALHEELDEKGYRGTIKVWNLYVLADHEAFEYCKKKGLSYRIEHIKAKNMEEALLWICKYELENRKWLPEEMKKYLIGKRYVLERVLGAHSYMEAKKIANKNPKYKQQIGETKYDETATSTRQRIGSDYHISYITVRKYGIYAEMIDVIMEVSRDLAKEILNGNIRISHENLEAIGSLPPNEIKNAANKILSEHKNNKNYSAPREILLQTPGFESRTIAPVGLIKNMPEYDPDAEVSSLIYTIPMWISSINRAKSATDMTKVSAVAKSRLKKALRDLNESIQSMYLEIKE